MDLNEIYQLVREDLEKVENELQECFPTTNNFLKKINHYLFQAKKQGKRLRPALVLFSTHLSAGKTKTNSAVISLAVALELIHTASLIHDDIIDNATTRHHQLTLRCKYGNQVAVLAGDILYAQAYNLLSAIGNPEIIKIVSKAVEKVCLGEIEETRRRDLSNPLPLDLEEEEYLQIIENKTASLFSACCHSAALLGKIGEEQVNALKEFGLNFGFAYQIVDDYLDLFGEKEKTGKSFTDLKEGNLTLPLIHLQKFLTLRNISLLKNCQVRKLLLKYKILDYIREKTKNYLTQAKEKLAFFAPSVYKDSLLHLTEYVYLRGK